MKLKINNKIEKPLWKSIKCICKKEIENKYPLVECTHCKCKQADESCPKDEFTIIKDNKKIKIKEITLSIGSFGEILGWGFSGEKE